MGVDNCPNGPPCAAVRDQPVDDIGAVNGVWKEYQELDSSKIGFFREWHVARGRVVAKASSQSTCSGLGTVRHGGQVCSVRDESKAL